MAQLNPDQVSQLAYNAGFRGRDLTMAVAVAFAESGPGNAGRPLFADPGAYNPELAAGTPTGSGSRGLWQIYGKAHPAWNNSSLFDPQTNANDAFALFQQSGWAPWTTAASVNGQQPRYLQFLPAAQTATAKFTGGATVTSSGPPSLPALGQGIQSAANVLGSSLNPLSGISDLFTRGGLLILALIVAIFGIVLIAMDPAENAAREGVKVAKLAGMEQ